MRVRWSIWVYGALFVIAVLWSAAQGRFNLFWPLSASLPAWLGVPLGLLLASIVIVFTRWSIRAMPQMKQLGKEFKALLGQMKKRDIIIVAAFSSIGEEAFFRGAMQPTLGIFLTGLIFGLLHFGPFGSFSIWTLTALLMGYALGGLYWLTGDLFGVIVAHFLVNYMNLMLIQNTDFGPPDPLDDKGRWPPKKRMTPVNMDRFDPHR